MKKNHKGAVASGHEKTTDTAIEILRSGGNAFDAAIAGFFTACVVEPILASLGGGGFLLAKDKRGDEYLFDCFVQTPKRCLRDSGLDFKPIAANFGVTTQEFHVGLGTVATPGMVKGVFEIHQKLGHMPLNELVAPAVALAKHGSPVNHFQADIFNIVAPICLLTPEARHIYASDLNETGVLAEGDVMQQPQLADFLDVLANEGEALFYQGEVADAIVNMCATQGGHLSKKDLQDYRVEMRKPLSLTHGEARILTNPPPSSGGILMAFALQLLADEGIQSSNRFSQKGLELLIHSMALTDRARFEALLDADQHLTASRLLDSAFIQRYKSEIKHNPRAVRGTTHISVMDAAGGMAALSVSNGEGCGSVVKNTGMMLNNMLGEEDLNTQGFHHWQEDQRMTSMMSPTLFFAGNKAVVLGSGGSNRIRTALLQTLLNMIDCGMTVEQAVAAPRVHYEKGLLNIEPGLDQDVVDHLQQRFSSNHLWQQQSLFFGGTHVVMSQSEQMHGAGDHRRGGVFKLA